MSKVLIIGGGAAGMMAAVSAAQNGNNVELFEKNEKLGKKLFITGKGRCNITNAAELEDFFPAVTSNPKFLYSAFYTFTNEQVISFFEELGVKINLNTEVKELVLNEDDTGRTVKGLVLSSGRKVCGDAVIVATGGVSYPSTGSTGDGYRFAGKCGHKVTELSPSLVPMEVKEWYAGELMGLSLRNIEIRITDGKKKLYQEFGEMLFTHYGVTGPVILSASSIVGKKLKDRELTLHIDLKPGGIKAGARSVFCRRGTGS